MTEKCETCGVPKNPFDWIAVYGAHEALVAECKEERRLKEVYRKIAIEKSHSPARYVDALAKRTAELQRIRVINDQSDPEFSQP